MAPSPEFLERAAKILGVREEWLRTGSGPKLRPADEAIPLRGRDKELQRLRELLAHRVKGISELDHVSFELFVNLLTRYTLGAPDGRGLLSMERGEDLLVELARDLMWLVNLPRDPRTWGLESLLDQRRRFDYFTASLHALGLLLPDAARGAPLLMHRGSLIPSLRLCDFQHEQHHHDDQEDGNGEN